MSTFEQLGILAAQISVESERLRDVYDGAGVLPSLERAAEAFVDEAVRRGGLDLDLVEGFKGLVLEAAVRRCGTDKEAVKKAFVLLGKETSVKSRNHTAQYEREFGKLLDLRGAFVAAAAEPAALTEGGATATVTTTSVGGRAVSFPAVMQEASKQ